MNTGTSFSTQLNKPQPDKRSGIVLATAAASLFLAALPVQAAEAKEEAVIHCAGVNACKGQGRCGSAEHSCKGANACKGQGILPMTKEECEAKGGRPKELVAPKVILQEKTMRMAGNGRDPITIRRR